MEELQDFCLHPTEFNYCRLKPNERIIVDVIAEYCIENGVGDIKKAEKMVRILKKCFYKYKF